MHSASPRCPAIGDVPNTGLHAGFLSAAARLPENPALEVDGRVLSYSELCHKASCIAATLEHYRIEAEPALTAVFAYRSLPAFAGILAALFRGHGYVPLNRTFPPERTRIMLERSGCRAIVADRQSAGQLTVVLAGVSKSMLVLLPEEVDVAAMQAQLPRHRVIGRNQMSDAEGFAPRDASPDAIAYLLFTSGSTGKPKAVMVAHRNVTHYLRTMSERYGITNADRCSQVFDLTFDLSVHDLFLTWQNGACLCCPGQPTLMKPGRFIREARLTVWFSVPSTAVFMRRFGELRPDHYPDLRLSLFCGEAFPAEVAMNWAEAAPHSVVENIYGPTELTIACTAYRWDRERSPAECELGLVPIGEPLAGMNALLVDEGLEETPIGTPGELLMSGPQVTLGYLDDPERTAGSFLVPPGKACTYYRTGDRVRRAGSDGPLIYLGRVDNQVKVLGHRVELGEIESALRAESGVETAVAVGWPPYPGGVGGIEAFLQTDECDVSMLMAKLKERLPAYMNPRKIHLLRQFPLNANGKSDRAALMRLLE